MTVSYKNFRDGQHLADNGSAARLIESFLAKVKDVDELRDYWKGIRRRRSEHTAHHVQPFETLFVAVHKLATKRCRLKLQEMYPELWRNLHARQNSPDGRLENDTDER